MYALPTFDLPLFIIGDTDKNMVFSQYPAPELVKTFIPASANFRVSHISSKKGAKNIKMKASLDPNFATKKFTKLSKTNN